MEQKKNHHYKSQKDKNIDMIKTFINILENRDEINAFLENLLSKPHNKK